MYAAQRGHSINLIKTSHIVHNESFEAIVRNGGIRFRTPWHEGERSASTDHATRDVAEGLDGVAVAFVMTQTLQHDQIRHLISPYVPHLKLLMIIPGYLGSCLFKDFVSGNGVIVAEGESTPFDARLTEPGSVQILFKNYETPSGLCRMIGNQSARDSAGPRRDLSVCQNKYR